MEIVTLKLSNVKELLQPHQLLEFNRKITAAYVAKMIESVNMCGLLRLPVIGDVSAFDKRGTAIIDGQHLMSAIVILLQDDNAEVMCMKKTYTNRVDVINDIAKLNSTQKSWTDYDYLYAWFMYGKDNKHYDNYVDLMGLVKMFVSLPISFMIDLFAKSKESFKLGEFEYRHRGFSMDVLLLANTLRTEYEVTSGELQGLRKWCFDARINKKNLDLDKLTSRLKHAFNKRKSEIPHGREDFIEFIEREYTRI